MKSEGVLHGVARGGVLLILPLLVGMGCGSSKPSGTSGSAGTTGGAGTGAAGTGAAGTGAAGTGAAGTGAAGSGTAGTAGPLALALSATGHDRFYGVTYDSKGSLFAVGQITTSTETTADIATVVAKLTPAGALDTTFGSGGFVVRNAAVGTNGELFRGIIVQSTGKIVVSGQIEHLGDSSAADGGVADGGTSDAGDGGANVGDSRDRDIALMRFNADGTKDTSFGVDGMVVFDLSTGTLNGTAFSADSAWGLAAYGDDRLVVSGGQVRTGGVDTDFVLLRLTADGARDTTFGTNGLFSLDTQTNGVSNNASPRNVTILPGTDGVIGAGYQPLAGADTKPCLYKVTDAGKLDTTFATNGVFSTAVFAEQAETYEAKVQPDATGTGYKLVTTGYGRQLASETTDLLSLRLTSAGVLDSTWGTQGIVRIDIGGFGDNSRRVIVLPDRRVVLVGGGRATAANVDGVVAFLTPDGQPDKTFSSTGWKLYDLGGPADFLWSGALSPDGKTLAAVGIKGVGTTPTPATANDDASLLLLSIP